MNSNIYEFKVYEEKNIIILQKLIRGFLVRYKLITPSYKQTKLWRKSQKWYLGGKKNECEIYQKKIIKNVFMLNIEKTDIRLNITDYTIINKKQVIKEDSGFEWTENFDGLIIGDYRYYFNLKFVCDEGGAQTRTLRELYHFINCQFCYLLKEKKKKYFINILDGDTSYKYMNKFLYLSNKEKYVDVKKYIYVGDSYNFKKVIYTE